MLKNKKKYSRVKMLLLLLIPILVIAILTIVIPYEISKSTLCVTPVVFIAIISFLIFLRSKYIWSFKDNKIFDKVSTIFIWIIFVPVIFTIGVFALFIVLIHRKSIYFLMWFLSNVTIFIFGIRIKISGILPEGKFIVIYNHCSNTDDVLNPLIMGYKKGWRVVFAEGEKRIPLVVSFLKYIGIPLRREELRSKKETSDKVISFLREQDGNILVFPEGRRLPIKNKDDLMMDFFPGAFLWSYNCNVPIVPVVVSWTFLFKPREGQWWFSPRTITINYLDSVTMREHESIDDFCQRTRESMRSKLKSELEIKRKWKLI